MVASYDFSRFEHIVDIGGGVGSLQAAILASALKLRLTLFDMPYLIEKAQDLPILANCRPAWPFAAVLNYVLPPTDFAAGPILSMHSRFIIWMLP